MTHYKNNLVIIENGMLRTYYLDKRTIWSVGRPTSENRPDIRLGSRTIGRKHGEFHNFLGIWFYIDFYGKNGTVFNSRKLAAGSNNSYRPVMLRDADKFVFGSGNGKTFSEEAVFGFYFTRYFDEEWRAVDTRAMSHICFVTGGGNVKLSNPEKGTVISREDGAAIYMGALTYITGNIDIA